MKKTDKISIYFNLYILQFEARRHKIQTKHCELFPTIICFEFMKYVEICAIHCNLLC